MRQPDWISSTDYDGKKRRLYRRKCRQCGAEFYAPKHRQRPFCGRTCMGLSQRSRLEIVCDLCGKTFERSPKALRKSRSGRRFCSRECKDKAQRLEGMKEIHPSHYGKGGGAYSYREKAFGHYGKRCEVCGYEEHEEMLDVNHRDGNRRHNRIENLQVLCVWHHAWLTRMVQKWNHVRGVSSVGRAPVLQTEDEGS